MPMKVAVLGAGGMAGAVISHLQTCADVKEIVAFDIREEPVREKEKQFGIRGTTRLDDILKDAELPLVFITASNAAHKELAVQAMEAGKAVMCEKPMAVTLADARAMVDTSERLGAFLQIGFECRYSQLYTTIKEWIDTGLLGQVINTHFYYICSEFHHKGSWRNKLATGGSMFGEKLSHYVDLPRWWIGAEASEVSTICAPNVIPYYEVRDNYYTTYRFTNGAVSQLTFMMAPGATFQGDPKQDILSQQVEDGHALRYLIVGTRGAVQTDVFRRTFKRWEFGDSPECFTSTLVETLCWEEKDDQLYFHNT